MNILVICHYFAPEPGAPSARLLELGQSWMRAGHTVKVVTCFPNHPTGVVPPEFRGLLRGEENLDGIQVYRNWVYATPNEGVIKKTIGHISFMVSSLLLSWRRTGPADVVIASSPTFFSLFSGYVFSRVKRAPFVVEIRDLWPAAIVELGVLRNRTAIRILEAMELWLYRVADHVVVVTQSFKDNLVARGIPDKKVSVITNGVDLERFSIGSRDLSVLEELGGPGRHIILYTGALGLSQGLEAVVEAASILKHRSDILFVFVGEGTAKPRLEQLVRELNLKNVVFLAGQPKERMAKLYRTADVCLVPLKGVPLFAGFIPSKMFEIMACGRPIVAAVSGESADILLRSGGALVVPPEDDSAIAEAVLTLVADPAKRSAMGRQATVFVREHYSRKTLATKYLSVLSELRQGCELKTR